MQQEQLNGQSTQSTSVNPQTKLDPIASEPSTALAIPELPKPTFGQKLADKMASKVGSWGFLIGQTTVLTAWVGCNLTPGMPHWDESPFILLNLVFSFASAYTAPVVLMSQNRQSDEDRANAMQNYQVNLQTAKNLELMHQKMDSMYAQKLAELTELIQKQSVQSYAAQNHTVQPHAVQNHTAKNDSENPATISAPLQPSYIGLLPNTIPQLQQPHTLPMVDVELFTQSIAKPETSALDSSLHNVSEHN